VVADGRLAETEVREDFADAEWLIQAGEHLDDLQAGSVGQGSKELDLVGCGVSAIGRVGPTYYQNLKRLDDYYAALDSGGLPLARGIELSPDDLVRRAVIQALTCHFRVSIESIELAYLVDFGKYFAGELKDLKALQDDGLLELQPDWIVVTPKGRLLVRAICMLFDRHLRERQARASYSKLI